MQGKLSGSPHGDREFPFFLEILKMNGRATFIAFMQTIGLYLSGFVLPPLIGQVLALFTPVPLIVASIRYGRREGMTALTGATILIALIGGWQMAAMLLFGFGLMAVGISESMRKRMKPEYTALVGGLAPVIFLAIALVFYFVHIGKNPIALTEEYVRSSMMEAAKVYAAIGLADMAATVPAMTDKFVPALVRLLPGITIATSVAQAALCYGIVRAALIRRPGPAPLPQQDSLAIWHAPDTWVWGLIGSLALLVVPNQTAWYAGCNLTILFAALYLAQGVALFDFYLRKTRMRPFFRGVVHTLVLALPSIVFVITVGIVDIWADFRKVRGPVFKA
jgi:uncharacterized protein YybS (DUF2232 family)